MAGDVLREFLVSVGYRVDGGSEAKAVSSAARVEKAVVGADRRVTDAQGVGSARRILQAGREAGIRTRGAAQLIAETKRVAEADAKHTQETVARSKDRERADKDAATASHGRSTAFVTATLAMAAAAAYAATRIGTALVQIAGNMEQVYYSSQRTKSSAANLRAFGYAAGQMGSSAGEANASLEALAKNMRSSPGYESMLNGLGVATQQNGQLRDTVDVVQDLGGVLAKMPGFQAKAYADALGIDERTLTALKSGEFTKHVAEYRDMLDKARLNPEKAAKDSAAFMNVWRRMQTGLEIIGARIEGALVERFGGSVTKFTDWLLKNSDRIADGVIRIGETILRLVGRVADLFGAFDRLDPATKGFIVQLGAMGAALMLLRAGPLGVILALGTGILALYDDFRKWKEGGTDTLIDWAKWEPAITSALKAFRDIWEGFDAVAKRLTGQDGLTVAFIALGTVLALNVLAPLGKIMTLLTGFGALRLPPWLLGLLGVAGLAGVANANGILGTGEAGQGIGERALRTLDPGLGDRVYGQSGADRAADGADNRTLWQKYAPRILGGRQAPTKPDASLEKGARESYDFWRSKGVSHAGAAGLVGMEQGESNFNPRSRGDGGLAHGAFQHHPDRRAAIMNALGIDISNATHQQQLEAAHWEFQGGDKGAAAVWARIKDAKSPSEAAALGVHGFERPADKAGEAAKRGGWAEGWANRFGAQPVIGGQTTVAGGFHPLDGKGRLTSDISSARVNPVTGQTRPHNGIDLAAPAGTDVKAMQGGLVKLGSHGDVTVTNPDGSSQTYRHVVPSVEDGARVAAGSIIAQLRANDPRSTGPHLHLEARDKDGTLMDPKELLAPKAQGETAAPVSAAVKAAEAIPKIEGALQRFDERLGQATGGAPKVMPLETSPLGSQSVTNANRTSSITAPQTNTFHISGASDPKAVGTEVGKAQTRVHADLLRNMQGAVA